VVLPATALQTQHLDDADNAAGYPD
jgi:hypothetical protein